MKNVLYIFSLLTVLGLTSCKEDGGEIFSPVPEIELISVSPTQVIAFRDSIVFEISYTDGDGDLGSMTENNLFIEDDRIQVTHGFRVQEIVPNGERVPITGTLRVILPNTIITDGSTSQSVTFMVYMKDQAGNESNHIASPTITVNM
jgi:hypothetical protein